MICLLAYLLKQQIVHLPYRSKEAMYLCLLGHCVMCNTLREKFRSSELFWSIFSRIYTEYEEIRIISPYLVRMRENTDQNNSEY